MKITIRHDLEDAAWVYHNGEKTKYLITKYGELFDTEAGVYRKIYRNPDTGYYTYTIRHNGKQYIKMAHRLVAEGHIPNPENKRTVNHLIPGDEGKAINRIDTLEWSTDKENVNHAWANGRCHTRKGSDSNFSKYTDELIRRVCELLEQRIHPKEIEKITGVTYSAVRDILRKETWTHISCEYDIDENMCSFGPKALSPIDEERVKTLLIQVDILMKPRKVCRILGIEYSNRSRAEIMKIRNALNGSTTIEKSNKLLIIINLDD